MDFRHELVHPNDDLPFRLFIFEGKNGGYKVPKHWHRSVELFLVLEGAIDFYINSSLFAIKSGQFILVNSNEVHSIDCPSPNTTIVLQIPSGLFENNLGNTDCLSFRRTCGEQDSTLAALIQRLYETYEQKKYGYRLQCLSDFFCLLHLLVTNYQILTVDEERRNQNRQLEKLSYITNYIEKNYREDLTLESVACKFGFSPSYLSRMFQKYAGINYKAYLLELRTDMGYRLLVNTPQSVGEIAMSCGFPDSRSFSKAFRKRYGTTPTEYRKNFHP